MPSLAETHIMKASSHGITIGMEIGNVEGELRGTAKCLLRILTKRFREIPEAIEEDILATTDLDRLELLFCCAIDCESLGNFSETLAENPNTEDTMDEKTAMIVDQLCPGLRQSIAAKK